MCASCSKRLAKGENTICSSCMYHLPRTGFHQNPKNKTSELFWGLVHIEQATSFFFFNKGSKYRKLIHEFKYRGNKNVAIALGNFFGTELRDSVYNMVDIIIPVPLHPLKEKKRGYNQSEMIVIGMSETMKKEVDYTSLKRIVNTQTQTKKNLSERRENVNSVFEVSNPENFQGKHILIVDDVVTTGSTLAACAEEVLKISGTKVSLATLGIAGS